MKRALRNLRGVVVFGGLSLNTIIWFTPLIVLAVVKLLLPVPPLRRRITRVLMWIGEQWVSVNTLCLSGSGSRRWTAEGLEGLSPNRWYLVVSNHQTWVDIVVLQQIFNRRVPFLKFFIKRELIWFPFLGIAWWAMDMPFMKRHSPSYLTKHPDKKGQDLEATRRACRKFRHTPTSVINFIEGTRFSEEKARRRRHCAILDGRAVRCRARRHAVLSRRSADVLGYVLRRPGPPRCPGRPAAGRPATRRRGLRERSRVSAGGPPLDQRAVATQGREARFARRGSVAPINDRFAIGGPPL